MESKRYYAGKKYYASTRRQLRWAAATVLLALPRAAVAQSAANPQLQRVIDAIRPNTLLRIETAGIHTGPLLGKSADSVLLGENDGPQQLAIADIRTIAESHRHTRQGAIVGAIFGGVAFGALGLLSGGAICKTSDCNTTHLGGLAAGGLLGLIFGSVGGAAAGFMQRGWRFLYPASA